LSACSVIVAAWFVSAWAPPPKYDYEPAQPYTVRSVPCENIPRLCKGWYVACALPHLNLIYVDERLRRKPDWLNKAIQHERAHLNGWRH
jgi:hypothetical protein